MSYNVVVWPRVSAQLTFKELAEAFVEVISKNYDCTLTESFSTDVNVTNIILGANDYIFVPLSVPSNSIIINLEQMGSGQLWNDPRYIQLLKDHPVWDYSMSNINHLRAAGVTEIDKFDIGYTKSLETCPFTDQHIDVLFFGALNQRRKDIQIKLQSLGYKVVFTANTFGYKRDQLIAKSKIVLNIHYYQSKILEVVRLSHLLANKKCVISEAGSEEDVNKKWCDGVVMCDYKQIVSNVLIYLFVDSKRYAQEERGYAFITQTPLTLPIS